MQMPKFPVNDNPAIVTKKKGNGVLEIETTHATPIKTVKTYNIAQLQKRIDKYYGVIGLWQDKITPLQAIIDEYNSMVK